MIRFMPLYDDKIERVMVINISHPITNKLMELVSEWIKSKKSLLSVDNTIYNYHNIYDVKNYHLIFCIKII